MKSLREWVKCSSIRRKIMALMLLGIAGIGIVSFLVSFFTMRSILTQRICETNQSTTETMANRIDELFASSTAAVVGIAIDETIQEHVGALYSDRELDVILSMNELKTLLSNYTYTIVNKPACIALLTANGTQIYNEDSFSHPGREALQQLYADYMSRFSFDSVPGQSPIKEYLPNPLSVLPNDYVYCISMPVHSSDEQHAAIVMMLIRIRYMTPYLDAGDEEYHTRVLADSDGTIVMAADSSLIGRSVEEFAGSDHLPADGKFLEASSGYLFCDRLDNFNGSVYALLDRSYIDRELWTVARNLLALDAVAVIVMVLVARLLAGSITRPIVRLSEKMAERKYAALASERQSAGNNEVRVLEYSFDVMQENIRQLMEQNRLKEQEKRATEIRALQSQIRPHFLFNTLNTVRCSIQNNNSEKAQNMILALSGLLRMTLVKGDELVPLREELEALQYYQDIMSMRTSMQFETFYQIESGLEDYRLPKLLLQPLVENSILHGFKCRKKDGEICIAAATLDDGIHILISDNGGMLDAASNPSSPQGTVRRSGSFSGIGLENIDRRIKLYYGGSSGVSLYTAGGYTVADVFLSPEQQRDHERGTRSAL